MADLMAEGWHHGNNNEKEFHIYFQCTSESNGAPWIERILSSFTVYAYNFLLNRCADHYKVVCITRQPMDTWYIERRIKFEILELNDLYVYIQQRSEHFFSVEVNHPMYVGESSL